MNKFDMHQEILNKMNQTYREKNADYGNSFEQVRNRMKNAILVRLFDKAFRIENLLNGAEQQVMDESIDDSLLDMANYCVMEYLHRMMDREKLSSEAVIVGPMTKNALEEVKWINGVRKK